MKKYTKFNKLINHQPKNRQIVLDLGCGKDKLPANTILFIKYLSGW